MADTQKSTQTETSAVADSDPSEMQQEQEMTTTQAVATEQAEERQRLIAEAAYYKAEKRGFEPGKENEDWLDAEEEVAVGQSPSA